MMPVTEKELDFKTDGVCYLRSFIPKDLITSLLSELRTYEQNPASVDSAVIWDTDLNGHKKIRYVPRVHMFIHPFKRLISSKILSVAASLLGEDVYCSDMDLHCRISGVSNPTPPHQDSFLWCFQDGYENMLSAYTAITDFDESTANLRVIRGSHLGPILPHKASLIRGFSSVIAESVDELPKNLLEREHEVNLKAGDVFLFHSKIIHYTKQEAPSENPRVAASVRIAGQSVRFSPERQAVYAKNIAYNRSLTIKEGHTTAIPSPRNG